MDRDLSHCYPPLATKALLIADEYKAANAGRELRVIGVWRSTAEQQLIYASGRTKAGHILTYCDGVIRKSNHQGVDPKGNPCSLAIDFGVFISGEYKTDVELYKPLQQLAHDHQLMSGWDFPPSQTGKPETDPPHIEIDTKLTPLDWSYLNVPPTSDSTSV